MDAPAMLVADLPAGEAAVADAVAQRPLKLDARRAIYTITRSRYVRNVCVPNFTPDKWWECDVFEATKTGRYREYEVKLTRGDFFCDSMKSKHFNLARGCSWGLRVHEKKHELLASRSDRGPTRFWYVTPAGLVQPHEVPEWAGLIEIRLRRTLYTYDGFWPWCEREIVAAPQLHRAKCGPEILRAARTACYWRMHKLMERLVKPKEGRANG